MNRRRFIAAAAAATTVVAGCLADDPPAAEPDDEPTDDPTAEPTASPEPTPHGPRMTDSSFEVTRVECGSDYGHHDVRTDEGTVTVEGVMDGRDTCYTADLVRGEYVREDDTLHVEVEAREGDDECMGGQCLVEIHYTATFAFEGGTPGRIEVEQRGATTTSGSTSESGSGSASAPTDDATTTTTPQSADD